MTKKFISAVLAVAVVVGTLCGCSAVKPNNYNFSGDIDENGIYTNNLFGFQVQIDNDWVLGNQEDYKSNNLNELENTTHDDFKRFLDKYGCIVDLIIYTQNKEKSISLYVYNSSFIQEKCEGKSYIDFLYESSTMKDSYEKYTKQFAGVDRQFLDLDYETIDSYSRCIFFELDEYSGHLIFICDTKEEADELTNSFTKLE